MPRCKDRRRVEIADRTGCVPSRIANLVGKCNYWRPLNRTVPTHGQVFCHAPIDGLE